MIAIPPPSFSTHACLPLSCCVFCFVHKKITLTVRATLHSTRRILYSDIFIDSPKHVHGAPSNRLRLLHLIIGVRSRKLGCLLACFHYERPQGLHSTSFGSASVAAVSIGRSTLHPSITQKSLVCKQSTCPHTMTVPLMRSI